VVAPFYIFKTNSSDCARYIEAVSDFAAATARVKALMKESAGEYLIFSQKTGHRISITPDAFSAQSAFKMLWNRINSLRRREALANQRVRSGLFNRHRGWARVKDATRNSSPSEYIILDQKTGEKISMKPPIKRTVFEIGYGDKRGLDARAELLRRFGHEVISAQDNDAAKVALRMIRDIDLFIVGHTAPERVRKEMVAWLKENYPKVKIVALNPSMEPTVSMIRAS
jgi:hypothetical protein